MAIAGLLIVISIITLAIYLRNYIRLVLLTFKLKGPKPVPIFGNVLILKHADVFEYYGHNVYKWFGSIMVSWVSVVPFIWIFEPAHIKVILGSSKVSQKSIIYDLLHNFLGRGLITNNGYLWKRNRKLIQPYFSLNVLESYIEIFNKNARKFSQDLPHNKDMNIIHVINECVLNILHESILGIPVDRKSPYRSGQVVLTERITKPWLLLESVFNMTKFSKKEVAQKITLYNYTEEVLVQKKKTFNKDCKSCLMDRFIEISENNPDFGDENIINETVTFMLAGQDSVGATLAFTLFFLAKYHDVQQKALTEIQEITGKNENVTLKDLNELKYLEQVIKESLRVIPSVPILSRVLNEDVTLDGKTFPKGTNILMSPYVTHRVPQHFPDPEKFDPERFSPANLDKMHPYAFLPFSAGPRNCIGYKFAILEIKTVLMTLLKKYQIHLKEDRQYYKLSFRATLRARGGIWLRFSRRTTDENQNSRSG